MPLCLAMLRNGRALLTLLVLATSAPRADADVAQAVTLHYDVYYLALRIVSVDIASRVEPAAYHTTASLQTAGIFAVIAPWESRATASGTIDGPVVRPLFYRVDSEYRDREQWIDLEYGSTGAVLGGTTGMLTDGERDEVPDHLRHGTLDPLTAGAAVARRLATTGTCAGSVPIFDGLRRYDLRYEDLGLQELEPSRRDPYRGIARHCRATIEPIAGFLRTGDRAGERASEVSAWLAPPLPGAAPVAVRLDLAGTRGTLHVHLARAVPGPP